MEGGGNAPHRRRKTKHSVGSNSSTSTSTTTTTTQSNAADNERKGGTALARHRRRLRHKRRHRRRSIKKDESSSEEEDLDSAFDRQISDLSLNDSDSEEDKDVEVTQEQVQKLEKQSFWFRKKKGLAGKLTSGSAGRAFLRMALDEETMVLLDVSRELVERFKDEKFSKLLHANVIRIATKTVLLHDNNTLSDDDFAKFRVPVRKICALVTIKFAQSIWDESVSNRICELIKVMDVGLHDMLKAHISSKSMDKLDMVVKFLQQPEFIEFCHTQEEEWEAIVECFQHFLEESR